MKPIIISVTFKHGKHTIIIRQDTIYKEGLKEKPAEYEHSSVAATCNFMHCGS